MSSPIVIYLSELGPILFEPAVAPGTPPAADHGAAASEAGLVNPPGSPAPAYTEVYYLSELGPILFEPVGLQRADA
jgi:hypothetical protein